MKQNLTGERKRPSDKPTNFEALNTTHAKYYFTFTIFLVSDIYDSDQAD
jgi:hypothetical protein